MEIKPLDNYKEREETIKSLIKENEMMRSALKTIIDNSVVINRSIVDIIEIHIKDIKILLDKEDPGYLYALGVYNDRERRREQ